MVTTNTARPELAEYAPQRNPAAPRYRVVFGNWRRRNRDGVRAAAPLGGLHKRAFDLVVAGGALVALSPVIGAAALAIRLQDNGPAFYGQQRIGRDGKPFKCLKLRTMVVDADAALQAHLEADPQAAREWAETRKLKRDPRITRLGQFLRKSSLDELPQLINIVRGEMSIVGPRPVVADELDYYGPDRRHYLAARPGLTGLWQISGRNDVSYESRVRLDVSYVQNWSLRSDIAIVGRTIPAVLRVRGSY